MLGHHQHASETPFKWRFVDGPAYSGIWILPPLINYKNIFFFGSAYAIPEQRRLWRVCTYAQTCQSSLLADEDTGQNHL